MKKCFWVMLMVSLATAGTGAAKNNPHTGSVKERCDKDLITEPAHVDSMSKRAVNRLCMNTSLTPACKWIRPATSLS